jgi:uncharacterized protein YbaP (TraB family)
LPVSQETIEMASNNLKLTSAEVQTFFRGAHNKVWTVSPERKAYTEITSESRGQIRARMDQLRAQTQQMVASLPPEQRQKMEAMMASRGMGPATLKSVEHRDLPATTFDIPAGYAKQDMGQGRPSGPPG